ncbi:MAG: hypothetical protein GY754_40385 [bacterium]|nr:hypothetical protein [bacterium]
MDKNDPGFKNVQHLAAMLQNMEESRAKQILCELEDDIRFDRDAFSFLALQLFNPQKLFNELAADELKYMLKQLEPEELFRVLSGLNKDDFKKCRDLVGKKRYEDAVIAKEKSTIPSPDAVMKKLLIVLGAGISKGVISYNGIALRLILPPCRPAAKKARQPGTILFQTLSPLSAPGQGIKIIVYVPEHPNTSVRVSLQGTGKRFFDNDSWLSTIRLNDYGFFMGDIFPGLERGPLTLWLELPGSGEVGRTVYCTEASQSLFYINIFSIEREHSEDSGRKTIRFRLEGKMGPLKEEKVLVQLSCSRCGVPIRSGYAEMEDGTGSFIFPEPEEKKGHSHDYYMHVFAGEHQAGTRINIDLGCGDEGIPLREEKDRTAGQETAISLPLESHERVIYHVSTSAAVDTALRRLISKGMMELEGVHESKGKRKLSPLELDFLHGDLLLLAERQGAVKTGSCTYQAEEGVRYTHYGEENVWDLYFSFYRITATGIKPVYRYISYFKREPEIWPQIPLYLNKGENIEIDVGYFFPDGGIFSIEGPEKKLLEKELEGRGRFSLGVEPGETKWLRWKGEGYPLLEKSLSDITREREYSDVSVEYIPPGTVLSPPPEGETIELFGSPRDVYSYFFDEQLLNYPWGCGEQTAAKLAGFALKVLTQLPVKEDNIYIRHIQRGIDHLLTYRNNEGLYSIFGDSYGIEPTALIMKNLSPVLPHKKELMPVIPRLFKIINDVREQLRFSNDAVQKLVSSPYGGVFSLEEQHSVFNTRQVLKNTHENLKITDGRLELIPKGFFSLPAYSAEVGAALLEEKQNSIGVFNSKEILHETQYRTGILGILEKLHILSPKIIKKSRVQSRTLDNAMEYILQSIVIAHLVNSSPSTVEIVSIMNFLNYLKKEIKQYCFIDRAPGANRELAFTGVQPVETPVEIVSPYTFVKRSVRKRPVPAGKTAPTVEISSRKRVKGDIIKIRYFSNFRGYEIYRFLLPAVLAPVESSSFFYGDQSLVCNSGMGEEIILRAKHRGRGNLKLLVENMYNPGSSYILDLGWIEVV